MISNRKLEPRVLHKLADDGAAVVLVEMVNCRGHFATLDLADWEQRVQNRSTRFFLNDNGCGYQYVRAASYGVQGNISSVARDLLAPGRHRVVGYHDGDRLNLRRKNLFVRRGVATGQTPAVAPAVAA